MSTKPKPVTVQILEKQYLVACKDEERDELLASKGRLRAAIS